MNTKSLPSSSAVNVLTHDITSIQQRFVGFNELRLQRIQSFLPLQQQPFLKLLPLLFHENNPALPGFISADTPAGITLYTPNKETLSIAQALQDEGIYQSAPADKCLIQGIYLMGSVSSLAFSKNSDIDIWLCHEPSLSAVEKHKLQEKTTAIEHWASQLDIEAHFFPIDSDAFLKDQKPPLSADSSGQTQHYLLLEEFYRTAIHIAGRTPIWWLVPPEEEKNYTAYIHQLKSSELIDEQTVIDFGSLENIPADEFISSTLWHLYKSLDAPYKSLLKLLLMQCYESEYPNPAWVSLELKKAIYQDQYSIDALDPYVLIYHKLEAYFQPFEQPEQLNFIRQCFYLKIMGDMEEQNNPKSNAYRQALLEELAEQYQWDEKIFARLTKNSTWTIKKASQENDLIIQQLKQYYLMVSRFAETNSLSSKHQDIQLIGRKLKSFLQKRPGKIDMITTRAAIHCKHNELTLIDSPTSLLHPQWNLYPHFVAQDNPYDIAPFKQGARSLVELLTWLLMNGLYKKTLQLHIHSHQLFLSESSIDYTLSILREFLLTRNMNTSPSLLSFKQPNRTLNSLLIINLGDTSLIKYKNQQFSPSDTVNLFSYGAKKESFVHTIDQVSISSWGEITSNRFMGLEGLFDCLISRFNLQAHTVNLSFECDPSIQHTGIKQAVEQLSSKINELFSIPNIEISPRLIVSGETSFYLFQYTKAGLSYQCLEDLDSLIIELSTAQIHFSPSYFNISVLYNSPIPFLFSHSKKNSLQVFLQSTEDNIDLYIIDERGSLFYQRHENASFQHLLTSYSTFLEILYNKGILDISLKIEYYELYASNQYNFHIVPIITPNIFTWDYFNIRITGDIYDSNTDVTYTLYCNDLEFTSSESKGDIFKTVADHIYDLRQNKERYPIHITEIDVPIQALGVTHYAQLQSIHFLRYKQAMELRLNG